MKKLKDTILEKLCHRQVNEKLIIKKDSKLQENIKIDITNDSIFLSDDINKIKEFANSLKIRPVAISNKYYSEEYKCIKYINHFINLYFFEDYLTSNANKFSNKKNDDKFILIITFTYNNINTKNWGCDIYTNKGWDNYEICSYTNIDEVINDLKTKLKDKYKDYI